MLMKIAFVVAILVGSVGLARADDSSDKVAEGSLSPAQITSRLQAQGFTISKIKLDDGRYKVKAIDAAGHKRKLAVSPATGEVTAKEDDD
jgi:hypothetical protein